MGKVFIMDHPLIKHKIGIIRDMSTGTKEFREMISEIAMLETYESTRDLLLEEVEIETPITSTTVERLAGKKLAIVPILRAGNLWNTTASCRRILRRGMSSSSIRCSPPEAPPATQSRSSRSTAASISASCASSPRRKG